MVGMVVLEKVARNDVACATIVFDSEMEPRGVPCGRQRGGLGRHAP